MQGEERRLRIKVKPNLELLGVIFWFQQFPLYSWIKKVYLHFLTDEVLISTVLWITSIQSTLSENERSLSLIFSLLPSSPAVFVYTCGWEKSKIKPPKTPLIYRRWYFLHNVILHTPILYIDTYTFDNWSRSFLLVKIVVLLQGTLLS